MNKNFTEPGVVRRGNALVMLVPGTRGLHVEIGGTDQAIVSGGLTLADVPDVIEALQALLDIRVPKGHVRVPKGQVQACPLREERYDSETQD